MDGVESRTEIEAFSSLKGDEKIDINEPRTAVNSRSPWPIQPEILRHQDITTYGHIMCLYQDNDQVNISTLMSQSFRKTTRTDRKTSTSTHTVIQCVCTKIKTRFVASWLNLSESTSMGQSDRFSNRYGQTDRQTGKHTYIQIETFRQTDGQTHRLIDTDMQTDKQINPFTYMGPEQKY